MYQTRFLKLSGASFLRCFGRNSMHSILGLQCRNTDVHDHYV